MKPASEFEALAAQIVSDASHVRCTKEEYRDGLEEIISQLEASLDAVNEELKREG